VSRLAELDLRTWLLLALRVLVLVSVIMAVPDFPSSAAGRFHQIAHSSGVPYRDFLIEYPIGQLGLIYLVGSWGLGTTRVLMAFVAFGADLAAFGSVLLGWGAAAARRYLLLGAPLLIFIYRRADLVAVALTALGLAVMRLGRSGGAWLGAGVLFRLWPAVLVPVAFIERRTVALRSFIGVTVTGLAVWALLGGVGGLRQVASFRGASGWELESTVGAVVWAITGTHRFEQGANRTGVVSGWAVIVLTALLAAGLTAIWLRARRSDLDPSGVPGLAAVALLLALSPLFSPQFVAWLLPMGAVASLEGRRWGWLAALPLVITGGIVTSWYLHAGLGPGWNQALLTLRNATVVAIPLAWLLLPTGRPGSGDQPRYADDRDA
jgi:hypothetical protein